MNATAGSVITEQDGITDEQMLVTYSEEERQTHEVNSANSSAIFTPQTIVFQAYLIQYGFSTTDILVYSFIRQFYSKGKRFYFTNEQLSMMFGLSVRTICSSLQTLSKSGIIKTSYKTKITGGTYRFIVELLETPKTASTGQKSRHAKFARPDTQNLRANRDKESPILLNIGGVPPDVDKKEYGDTNLNLIIQWFTDKIVSPEINMPGITDTWRDRRIYAKHVYTLLTRKIDPFTKQELDNGLEEFVRTKSNRSSLKSFYYFLTNRYDRNK